MGQLPLRKVSVMCDDLNLLTLIFHFTSLSAVRLRWPGRLNKATVGSSLVEKVAVLSANV